MLAAAAAAEAASAVRAALAGAAGAAGATTASPAAATAAATATVDAEDAAFAGVALAVDVRVLVICGCKCESVREAGRKRRGQRESLPVISTLSSRNRGV